MRELRPVSEWTTAGVVAAGQFTDARHARLIYFAAAGLFVVGVVLGVGTWLWWRSAKVEHPSLGPLEVMGTRRWRRADFMERTRRLEAVRPIPGTEAPATPELVDLDDREHPHDFGDLAETADPTGGTTVEPDELDVEAIVPIQVVDAEPVELPVSVDADAAPAEAALVQMELLEPVPAMRSIVIDTSPKPAEGESEAPAVDPTPAAPIDPLLRLWSE